MESGVEALLPAWLLGAPFAASFVSPVGPFAELLAVLFAADGDPSEGGVEFCDVAEGVLARGYSPGSVGVVSPVAPVAIWLAIFSAMASAILSALRPRLEGSSPVGVARWPWLVFAIPSAAGRLASEEATAGDSPCSLAGEGFSATVSPAAGGAPLAESFVERLANERASAAISSAAVLLVEGLLWARSPVSCVGAGADAAGDAAGCPCGLRLSVTRTS